MLAAMPAPGLPDIDHALHDTLVGLLFDQGAQDLAWLTRRARQQLRDASIDEEAVVRAIEVSTLMVPRPTGAIDHSLSVIEGNVFTHRVRADLRGRRVLWLGTGVQPLLNVAAFRPIPLADGSGEVTRAEGGLEALLGPVGWLPDVRRFELVGLRIVDQQLEVESVDEAALPDAHEQLRVRRWLSEIYTRERYWHSADDTLATRPAEFARTISLALLEDPELFATPYPPLDELLHNPFERPVDDHWRDVATSQQIETTGFWLDGVPAALEIELNHRAQRYGMSLPQFIVALLGTLAWRTPFAEDMEPWDDWDPERKAGTLHPLPGPDGGAQ